MAVLPIELEEYLAVDLEALTEVELRARLADLDVLLRRVRALHGEALRLRAARAP